MTGKLFAITTIAGFALAMAAAAQAQDAAKAQALAKSAGCTACHDVSSKKVGPSFKESAAKFGKQGDKVFAAVKADPNHKDMLKGVPDGDLRTITDWIATL